VAQYCADFVQGRPGVRQRRSKIVTEIVYPQVDRQPGGLLRLGRGPTGWDVARRARELNEDLPIVYMTGGNGHEWASQGVPNSILIAKPFAPAQIVTAVSHLLNISEH
jgi:hypothetical protein